MEADVLLQKLKNWGCDVEGAMNRLLDDTSLYQQCLIAVCGDPAFGELGKALEAEDSKAGFDAAHTLKGVLANLGLTPMYDTTVCMVEPLRAGNSKGLQPFYEKLLEQNEHLKSLLGMGE